jgi:hypothetical protein
MISFLINCNGFVEGNMSNRLGCRVGLQED